jgi:hypothetical protein
MPGELLMSVDINRLLIQFEHTLREINREQINPEFEELAVADLEPVLRMVATARRDYLRMLFHLAESSGGAMPEDANINALKQSRLRYEELLNASKALQTAVERGYLDVKPRADGKK